MTLGIGTTRLWHNRSGKSTISFRGTNKRMRMRKQAHWAGNQCSPTRGGSRERIPVLRKSTMRGQSLCCGIALTVALLMYPGPRPAFAQNLQPKTARLPLEALSGPMWDMAALSIRPKWTTVERPIAPGVKAVFYDGLPFRGKPTRVFAWVGVPNTQPGHKLPAMVLVHGGGG